jgi:hypothetical protein
MNCTFSGNLTHITGGGMSGGTATNCIAWYNSAPGTDSENFYETDVFYSCSPDVTHGENGNITNAPLFCSNSHIASNSPCVGAGTDPLSSNDFDGDAWKIPPSMGCDEPAEYYTGFIELDMTGLPSKVVSTCDVAFSANVVGSVSWCQITFGDGEMVKNHLWPIHRWSTLGEYDVILSAYNDDNLGGVAITQRVSVVSAESVAIYVALDGNDLNTGENWEDAKASIQAGVDAQFWVGGTVWVSNATYNLTEEITVTNSIIVQSVGGPETTVIDGGGSNRCFSLSNSSKIGGFTITNGYAEQGGGIRCADVSSIITNCIITGNSADRGSLYLGTALNCTFRGNSVTSGGGMAGGWANNCSFISNSASYASGGMDYGKANNCIFVGNSASKFGGGSAAGIMINCNFLGNSSFNGGGMYKGSADNCLFNENSAGYGGGMADGRANNCTFIGNTADPQGGGMTWGKMNNCIVWNNTARLFGNNLIYTEVSYSCSPGLSHGNKGNISMDPLFIAPAAGDYHLQSNSPCINWGNNSFVKLNTDLNANPRIVENYVDMGAYEYQGIIGLVDSDRDGLEDAWEWQFFAGNVLPYSDPDHDGHNNKQEYITGMNPVNSSSCFEATISASETNSFLFTIEWPSVTGRVYNVLWTPSLNEPFASLESGIAFPRNSYTDTVHSAKSTGYYRIVVQLEGFDSDGDGMPNEYELNYFLNPTNAVAGSDADGDGYSNLMEYISGSNPTNSASFFTASIPSQQSSSTGFVIEWLSLPDRTYTVLWTDSLTNDFQTLKSGILYPLNTYTDTIHSAEDAGAYKVEVRLE